MPHILIVDDEDKIRHLLSMMLERKGFKTDQAANGREALEKLKSASYDMVFSDIRMPEVDGRELIKRMKEANIVTPVVFITAFATVDSAVEMMRQGAADYVTKPFDEEKILIAVERTLKLSSLIAENKAMRKELQRSELKVHEGGCFPCRECCNRGYCGVDHRRVGDRQGTHCKICSHEKPEKRGQVRSRQLCCHLP
jgi:DNA-binding NtrC family response regulator